MTSRSLLLFATLLTGLTTPASLVAQEFTRFSIGTWNIEFLGASPHLRRDTAPRTERDLLAIGKKVRELSVAALAVQEICGEGPLRRVATAIGPSWRHLLGTTGSWDDGKTQQGVGFLYDDAVLELLHSEELLDFPRERDGFAVFHRKPVTACFRHRASGADFRLVVVHLKAGRKSKDLSKRRVEATHLREWIDELQADPQEDQDIIVLGDFNCTYGAEPARLFEQGAAMQYLEPQRPAPTIVWFDDPIDQIVVAKGFAELQRDSRRVHDVTGANERLLWRKTYSDHFPVTATLVVKDDDDPDATFRRGPPSQFLPLGRRPAGNAEAGAVWPPAVGSRISVTTDHAPRIDGRLLHPVPAGPGGWVVIETANGPVAIPFGRVLTIRFD